jgi:hypothetical protein
MRAFVILLLFTLCRVVRGRASRRAIFLVGDSTYQRVYTAGLVSLCVGTPDPLAKRKFEFNGCSNPAAGACKYQDSALLCAESSPFTRIGYTIHWGVQNEPYHNAWQTHRSLNDTTNSVANIVLAIQEFQMRSEAEGSAIFLFVSNLWEVKRYQDHFWKVEAPVDFALSYGKSLLSMVSILRQMMRPLDLLILATSHMPVASMASFVFLLNEQVRITSNITNVMLFDESTLVGEDCVRDHLEDQMHQKAVVSMRIADYLHNISKMASIFP